METSKAHIIEQLRKEILPLQGYKPVPGSMRSDTGLGPIVQSFPNKSFPLGAIHEFITDSQESAAATTGFLSGLLGKLMGKQGVCIWISPHRNIFPPALKYFDVEPGNVLFIELKKEKEILWATEEALRCEAVTAVVSEVSNVSFTASRRLQLAVENSLVNGFIVRHSPKYLNTTACITRWKINSIAGELPGNMPGVGFPKWNVELLKVRNGYPGQWNVSWENNNFRHSYKEVSIVQRERRKTG